MEKPRRKGKVKRTAKVTRSPVVVGILPRLCFPTGVPATAMQDTRCAVGAPMDVGRIARESPCSL